MPGLAPGPGYSHLTTASPSAPARTIATKAAGTSASPSGGGR
jgi:hypothetical protein